MRFFVGHKKMFWGQDEVDNNAVSGTRSFCMHPLTRKPLALDTFRPNNTTVYLFWGNFVISMITQTVFPDLCYLVKGSSGRGLVLTFCELLLLCRLWHCSLRKRSVAQQGNSGRFSQELEQLQVLLVWTHQATIHKMPVLS